MEAEVESSVPMRHRRRFSRALLVFAVVLGLPMACTIAAGPASGASITIQTPKTDQVLQRDAGDGTADVSVTGTVSGVAGLEASMDGGATWHRLTVEGTTFSGVIADQPAGRRTLTVRDTGGGTSASVPGVGVGDVFVLVGDSNSLGHGTSLQQYGGPPGQVTLYTNKGLWKPLTGDPVDMLDEDTGIENCLWIFIFCKRHALYDSSQGGSIWPLVATELAQNNPALPIAFVSAVRSGSRLVCDPAVISTTCWQKASGWWVEDRWNSLYADLMHRLSTMQPASGGVRALVWLEGINDLGHVNNPNGKASYTSYLKRFVDHIRADLNTDVMVSQPGDCDPNLWSNCAGRELGFDNLRTAVSDAWQSMPGVLRGPVLYDVDKSDEAGSDGLHYRSPGDLSLVADRVAGAMQAAFYGGTSQQGPRLTNAVYNAAGNSIDLTFDDADLVAGQPVAGITVEASGVAVGGVTSTATGSRNVRAVLPAGVVAPYSVSVGAGRSGVGVPVVRDGAGLPAEVTLDRPVTGTQDPPPGEPTGPVTHMTGSVTLVGGTVFTAAIRPVDWLGLRGSVYVNGTPYVQANNVARCGQGCVQGSATWFFLTQNWKLDRTANTVTLNGVTRQIVSGSITVTP